MNLVFFPISSLFDEDDEDYDDDDDDDWTESLYWRSTNYPRFGRKKSEIARKKVRIHLFLDQFLVLSLPYLWALAIFGFNTTINIHHFRI